MKLNAKQEKFAQNVVAGMTQTEAYCDAYGKDGSTMTQKSMWERASRVMANPAVQERVKELRDKIAADAVISAQKRKEWLTDVIQNPEIDINARLRASDQLNKMEGEYVAKIQGEVKVKKLEDLL